MATSTNSRVEKDWCLKDFDENGFAGPISILSSEDTDSALKEVEEEFGLSHGLASSDNIASSNFRGDARFKVHLFLPEINRIVHHPILLQAVRKALGNSHIVLWSCDLNIKLPQTKNFFSEHQDATYTGLEPADKCLTVWIALSDPVGVQEGCMSFLRGSHKFGQVPHVDDTHEKDNMLSRGQRVCIPNDCRDETQTMEWVAVPLRGGQATFHHFHTIHQSGANQHPSRPRIGLALRYMATCVRQTGPKRESVTWIDNNTSTSSKNADNNNDDAKRKEVEQWFDLEHRLPWNPSLEDIAAGRCAHQDAMKREASNYFHGSTNVKAYDEKERQS